MANEQQESTLNKAKELNPVDLVQIYETLPERDKEHFRALIVSEQFQGPLPSPKHLEQYNKIVPGAANRIIEMAEKEQAHQHEWNNKSLRLASRQTARGQWMAFILSLVLVAVAVWTIFAGHPTVGGIIFGTTVVGLAAAFISQTAKRD